MIVAPITLIFQTSDDPEVADRMVAELNTDVPKDSTILEGLRATRGLRMTAENAAGVFVKWPALANQRYVSEQPNDLSQFLDRNIICSHMRKRPHFF